MSCLAIIIFTTVQFPFHSRGLDGEKVVELAGESRVEVISMELHSESDSLVFSYTVEGVRIAGPGHLDTLFWLSDQPALVLAQARMAGVSEFEETRTLEILVLDESCIGGLLRVLISRSGRTPSEFIAFRTWLYNGTALDLESIIQMDQVFFGLLSDSLGLERGCDVETELWINGFWLDPQSFLLVKGTQEPPVLRLGLPSTVGSDTILVVNLPVTSLNSAAGAMMD